MAADGPWGLAVAAAHRIPQLRSAGDRVLCWHHGTPNIGAPPAPLFELADELGVRWVSYDRPGYGGSTPVPDRTVASAAGDVAAITDTLASRASL